MSPYPYRRLMREKLARRRQHAGAPPAGTPGARIVSLLALNRCLSEDRVTHGEGTLR